MKGRKGKDLEKKVSNCTESTPAVIKILRCGTIEHLSFSCVT